MSSTLIDLASEAVPSLFASSVMTVPLGQSLIKIVLLDETGSTDDETSYHIVGSFIMHVGDASGAADSILKVCGDNERSGKTASILHLVDPGQGSDAGTAPEPGTEGEDT